MSIKKVHDKQPSNFEFSSENLKIAESILKKYPSERKKSAKLIGNLLNDCKRV